MPADLSALESAVTNATTVEASAAALINGFAARITAAVDAAIANGATAAQLAPIVAEADALTQQSSALQDAITANTPAA